MSIPLFHVDAFTNRPFAGNPAAVCLLSEPQDAVWMQSVAREMNLSETAFLCPRGDGFELRWFTPLVEVDLCGHATLASAHILWEEGVLAPDREARFQTRSGLLTARRLEQWIELNFPAEPPEAAAAPDGLLDALGAPWRYLGRNRFDYLCEVDSEEVVRGLSPDFARLRLLTERGVIVTSASASTEFDFVSRFFAPAVGVDEDPVTGSAHCCLGPYWAVRLGRNDLTAFQASSRGGVLRVKVGAERVLISGQAVTICRGGLAWPRPQP
jgi:predicted PhzF superfamily epimerase YddE/YHI9